MKKIIYGFLIISLTGCNQLDKDLNTKIIGNSLCIFTNESKDYGKDSFLVHIGKVVFSEEYQSEYERSYENINFPIDEKSCVFIPLSKIEKNVAYSVNLSTINQLFSSQVCILEQGNNISIKSVEMGKAVCN